jgi:tRNA (cmo5U34)-methyltransferase
MSERDELFSGEQAPLGEFAFNDAVATVFDDMLVRSVPFYLEQQAMARSIAAKFWVPGSAVYDLGCSTGTTLVNLAADLPHATRLVGIDSSEAMLERAGVRIEAAGVRDRVELLHADLNEPLDAAPLRDAGLVTMFWTLQFVRPLRRDAVVSWIYDGMVEDGVLVITEKVLTDNGDMNRFFIELYYDFKRRNGYSNEEIARKREALENTLVPYRSRENIELLQRNGFEIVETFFQWFNFAGYLAVKKPSLRRRPNG